jgi:hypothetical protein
MADAPLTAKLVIDGTNEQWTMPEGSLRRWLGTLATSLWDAPASAEVRRKAKEAQWDRFPFESLLGPPRLSDRKDARKPVGELPPWWSDPESALPDRVDDQPPQQLGFILRQFYSVLEERRRDKDPKGDFHARFRRIHDLRMLSAGTKGESTANPPLLYIGDWSQVTSDALLMELTVTAAAWANSQYREACQTWLRDGQDAGFAFGIAPLRVYELDVRGSYSWSDEQCTLEDVTLQITLPHAWGKTVVGRLPSILSIACPAEACDNKKPETLLVSSPHLRRVAAEMSEIWEDPSLRRTLLIAPPGSGKEVLARFLHAGVKFYAPVEGRCPNCARTLAEASFVGQSVAEASRTLFGHATKKPFGHALMKTVSGAVGNPDRDAILLGYNLVWRHGLLQEARGTVVFIDEVDKATEGFRASLLRFLENDEIQPDGYPTPIKLADQKVNGVPVDLARYKARLLFAGSKAREDMFALNPPDFWTRMLRVIEMAHPFEIHDLSEREVCAAEYFLMFLYRTVLDRKSARADYGHYLKWVLGNRADQPDPMPSWKREDIVDRYPHVYFLPDVAWKLSMTVAEFLAEMPTATLSVRNLKALVKRLDYQVRLRATRGIDLKGSKRAVKAESERGPDPKTLEQLLTNQNWIWAKLHETAVTLLR